LLVTIFKLNTLNPFLNSITLLQPYLFICLSTNYLLLPSNFLISLPLFHSLTMIILFSFLQVSLNLLLLALSLLNVLFLKQNRFGFRTLNDILKLPFKFWVKCVDFVEHIFLHEVLVLGVLLTKNKDLRITLYGMFFRPFCC